MNTREPGECWQLGIAVACVSHTARQRDKTVQPGQIGPYILSCQMRGTAELDGSVMIERQS